MKANELRIGNIIQTDEQDIIDVIQVNSYKPHNIQTDKGTWNEKALHGIILTEEWLLKFGFEKEDMGDLGIHLYMPISEDSDYCLSWSGGTIWLEQCDLHIKFVHQLQNLYFALTGQELTLK